MLFTNLALFIYGENYTVREYSGSMSNLLSRALEIFSSFASPGVVTLVLYSRFVMNMNLVRLSKQATIIIQIASRVSCFFNIIWKP